MIQMETDMDKVASRHSRPMRILLGATIALVAAVVVMSWTIARNLRAEAISNAEISLRRQSLILSGQAERSFQSVLLVLSNIEERVVNRGVFDSTSYGMVASDHDTHEYLKETLAGLPQLEAITMIDATGRLINFSRYWPIPSVNVADRDYFLALSTSSQTTFIGQPVQNRGTGTWNIYVARRLNGSNGEFAGLVLAAMSLKYFEDFYKSISLEEANSIAILREDGILLARYPTTQDIGRNIATDELKAVQRDGGTLLRGRSPVDHGSKLIAVRRIAGLPMMIVTTQSEEAVLGGWKKGVHLLIGVTAGLVVFLVLSSVVISRKWRQEDVLRQLQSEKQDADNAKFKAEAALFRQQERNAESSNRAKSNFLAVMSHEIRTPMNAVLGLTSSLLDTDLTADQRESLQAIHLAGDSLLEILNDILDFSKLEAGNLTLEQIPFSPTTIVDNMISVIGATAAAKGLELRFEGASDMPPGLLGDPSRIRQILLNLTSNAIKFTPSGEIVVRSECLRSDAVEAVVRWSVIDTGMGIPPDRIEHLFNDFVQADISVSRRFGGSGLGLAICRRLVEQMGGEIRVLSKMDVGSTFEVDLTLPICNAPAASSEEDDTWAILLKQRIEESARPLRILVVDDNKTNRLVVRKMFQEYDIEMTEASDGVEGVEAVSGTDFDLIFMDMRMPEMDGLTATTVIRAFGGRMAWVPIVAFTANAFSDDQDACIRAGMTDFVAKPVRKRFLVQAALRALWDADVQKLRLKAKEAEVWQEGKHGVPADDAADCFDASPYEELATEIGKEGAIEACEAFIEDVEQRLNALERASEPTGDLLQAHTHSIKSTAATFGLTKLAGIARQLEREASDIPTAERIEGTRRLRKAFEEGLTKLQAFKLAA